MLQALTAPLSGTLALAGIALGLGVAAAPSSSTATHNLRLHAVDQPGAVYLTRFHAGDLRVKFNDGKLQPIVWKNRAKVFGCRAIAIETLTPRDAHSFHYDYREQILSCDPDAPIVIKTPRKGVVTVED